PRERGVMRAVVRAQLLKYYRPVRPIVRIARPGIDGIGASGKTQVFYRLAEGAVGDARVGSQFHEYTRFEPGNQRESAGTWPSQGDGAILWGCSRETGGLRRARPSIWAVPPRDARDARTTAGEQRCWPLR